MLLTIRLRLLQETVASRETIAREELFVRMITVFVSTNVAHPSFNGFLGRAYVLKEQLLIIHLEATVAGP